ncbi:MAG: DHHA1 domain-containing protein [Candidatus Pacearchaeota archaeon]
MSDIIKKIKEILMNSSNPLYFFDNDVDGLASFLLFKKTYEKGKGVAIKTFPELSFNYIRKIEEINPDSIFVLDKPKISKLFLDYIKDKNYHFVWIDHHKDINMLEYFDQNVRILFNPTILKGISKPTTYWVYELIENKKYLWIAGLGCISDWFIPEYFDQIYNEYKDLFEIGKTEDVSKILYETSFGKIIQILNFGLKDTTTNITKMLKFLSKVETPYEILEINEKNKGIHKRFNYIYKKFSKLIEKAENFAKHEILFFQYGGNLSISAEISNALLYKYPNKIIVVAYLKGDTAKISIRSRYKIRDIVIKAINGIENASAGGHDCALGASMKIEDLDRFKSNLLRLWKEEKKNLIEEKI